jgi:hypothetical protein
MMREFQAETDKRRTNAENHSPALLNAESNELIVPTALNDQSAPSTPTKQRHLEQQTKTTKNNLQERRGIADRNKISTKTNKLPTDTLKVRRFLMDKSKN